MNSMNNSKPEINFNDIINNVKIQSPVATFNFDINEKFNLSVIGFHLVSLYNDDLKKLLDEKSIMENVNDNTILFFNTHHIIELSYIINGCLDFMITMKFIDENYKNNELFKLITFLHNPIKYKDLTIYINSMLYDFKSHCNSFIDKDKIDIVFYRLKIILSKIWFVPYNVLDEICSKAIDDYVANNGHEASKNINNIMKEELSNEGNGETS